MSTLVNRGTMTLPATSTRIYLDSHTAENQYSYLFCTNSPSFFSSDVLGNLSYANYDVVSSLVENIARIDDYASIDLGGISGNSANVGGKPLSDLKLYPTGTEDKKPVVSSVITRTTVFVMLVPVAIAISGIVVFIRRKFL